MRRQLLAAAMALGVVCSLTACSQRTLSLQDQLDQLVAAKGDQLVGLSVDVLGKKKILDLTIAVLEADQVNWYELFEGDVQPNGSHDATSMTTPTPASDFDLDDLATRAQQLAEDEACSFASMIATPTPFGMAVHPRCADVSNMEQPRDQLATLDGQPAYLPAAQWDDLDALMNEAAYINDLTGSTQATSITFAFDSTPNQIITTATLPGTTTPCLLATQTSPIKPTRTAPPYMDCDNINTPNTFTLDEPTLTAILDMAHTIQNFPITQINAIEFRATEDAIQWSVSSDDPMQLINNPQYAKGTIPKP